MLSKLKIKNFQSHKDTTLDFHEGLNAIVGSSDSGKSSILRSIEWLLFNRPRGDGFVSWWKDVDKTMVEGVFDSTVVTKTRSKTLNQYQIDKGEPLKALRSDVPDEVRAFFKVSEINLQKQHEAYFLLQDSASTVASKFNDVAGLQVMDECVAQAKALNRALKQESDVLFESIHAAQIQYNDLNWIDDAENAVNEAAVIERSIIDLKDKKDAVSRLCEQVDGVCSAIKQIDKLIDLQDAVQEAIALYDAICGKKKHLDMLTALLDSHSSYSFSISKIQSMVNEHNSIIVDEAVSLHGDMLKLADKKCNIQILIESIEEVNNKIVNLDVELNDMTQNFEGSMNNYSSCPLCDSIIERALNEGV